MAGMVEGRTYVGLEGLDTWAADMAEAFEEMRAEVHEVVPMGDDQVVVIVTWHFKGRGSGVEHELRVGHLWTFLGGKAIRMTAFTDQDEARAVAGA
jgi:ketosteroid isomerase-like protein